MYTHQDNMKHQKLRRVPSRRGMGRNVGEAELLQVLQRRRRAMGDQQDQTQGTLTLSSLSVFFGISSMDFGLLFL